LTTASASAKVTPPSAARVSGLQRSCGVSLSDLILLGVLLAGCIVFWVLVTIATATLT